MPAPASAQAATAPDFVVGPNKVYCHASADSLTGWINTVKEDGTTPFYLTGAPQSTTGVAMDPVANAAFTATLPLTPKLGTDIVLDGTINVQAYIGGGVASHGVANIGVKLSVAGATIASAAAKQHVVTGEPDASTTYDAISWTMTVSNVAIPAGAEVAWVVEGSGATGNNFYLACHTARGSSYIELPVKSAGGGGAAPPGPVTVSTTTGGTAYLLASGTTNAASAPCSSARYPMQELDVAPAAGKAYTARSFAGLGCTTNLDFTTTTGFAAVAPVVLTAIFGCDAPSPTAGTGGALVAMRFHFYHGTSSISGDINQPGANCVPGTPLTFTVTADLGGEVFAAGDILNVAVIPFYATTGAGEPAPSLYLAVGATGTRLSVPDLAVTTTTDVGGGVGSVFEDIVGSDVDIRKAATAATTQAFRFNWTTAFTSVNITTEANITAGSVEFSVADHDGNVLAGGLLTAPDYAFSLAPLAVPGNWTINITFDRFVGWFNLTIVEEVGTEGPVGPPTVADQDYGWPRLPGSGSGADSAEAAQPGKQASTLPFVYLLGLVLVTAMRRRRA